MPLLFAALLTLQTATQDPKIEDPNKAAGLPATAPITYEVPIGASAAFSRLAGDVKRASSGDRAKAGRLAGLLPRRHPAIYWDERNVPPASRANFRAARDYALGQWSRLVTNFAPRFVDDPKLATSGLVFSFEPTLARGAGATHFLATETTLPRLETVIGLNRGDGPSPAYTGEADVQNEVLYALGLYLGLDPSPTYGGAMGRTDLRAVEATSPSLLEAGVAAKTLLLSDRLRATLAKGETMEATAPRVWTEKRGADLGSVRQGDPAEVRFTVANNGDGPLRLAIVGDCGCLGATGPTDLAPGETGVILARYDTSIISGGTRHNVVLRTNDPETPRLAIPLEISVRPPVQVLMPAGTTHLLESGNPFEIFVIGDEGSPVTVTGAKVDGVAGDLKIEPWRGTLDVPGLGEGKKAREGYRLLFTPKPDALVAPGRRNASVEITLAGGKDPLRTNFFLQRGIAAVPQSVSFGMLDSTPGDAELTLSRPGRPFAITGFGPLPVGVELLTPAETERAESHLVRLRVRPDRLKADLKGTVIVRTDDPAQPRIAVPVSAILPN